MNHEKCVQTPTYRMGRFRQAIRDASRLAILLATRLFPLQVRNSNWDGASESQNCFDESLTRSSYFETVNIVIEFRLSDDMRVVLLFFSDLFSK